MCQHNKKSGLKIAFLVCMFVLLSEHQGMQSCAASPSIETINAEKAVLQSPTNEYIFAYIQALLNDAKVAYKLQNYEEAADYLRSALYFLKNQPNSDEYKQSKQRLNELIQKMGTGTSPKDRFETAKGLFLQGKNFPAAYEFSNLLQDNYETDLCYEYLGDIANKMGYGSYALSSYKNAFRINPNNYSAKYKYSMMIIGAGKEADAIYQLAEVIENTNSTALIQEIIHVFTNRTKQNPNNENNYDILGLCYQRLGQYDKTYKYLKKSLSINPNDIFIRYHLGNLLFNIKEFSLADDIYSEVLNDNPYESQIRISRAKAYKSLSKDELAIKDYQIVLAMYPDSLQAQFGIYDILKSKAPLDKIVSLYYPIDSNIKFDDKGYAKLGFFANKIQRPKDAVVFFEKAISINPKSESSYVQLYRLYQLLNEDEKAKQTIMKAYNAFPKNSDFIQLYSSINSDKIDEKSSVAQAYFNDGDYKKAIAVYEQIEPKNYDTYFAMANCYRQLSNLEKAIENYNKAVELNPNDSEIYYILGTAYIESNNMKQAGEAFKKSVQLNGSNEKAKKMLSVVQQKEVVSNLETAYKMYDKKDYKTALSELNKAAEIYREDPEIYYYRGLTKDELGDYKGAIDDYKMTINLDRRFTSAYFNLAVDLERTQHPKEALYMYEKFLGADNIDPDMAKTAEQRMLELGERYY